MAEIFYYEKREKKKRQTAFDFLTSGLNTSRKQCRDLSPRSMAYLLTCSFLFEFFLSYILMFLQHMKCLSYKATLLSLYRKSIQIRQDRLLGKVSFLGTGTVAVFPE